MAFKKSNSNFEKTANNRYEKTDYNHTKKYEESIVKRNKDQSADAEKIMQKVSTKVYSHALWADDCDIQCGGQGYDAVRHKAAVDTVMSCFNTIYGLGGDLHNNASALSKADVYGDRLSPSESITAIHLLYDKYKKKISYVLGGNHDDFWAARLKATNLSMTKHTADKLGADYIPFALVYQIPLLTPKNEVKNMTVYVQHNVNGNKLTATDKSLNLVYSALLKGFKVDIVQTEHLHTGSEGVYTIPLSKYDKNGVRLGDENHYVFIVNGKTWQKTDTTFYATMGMNKKTNLKVLDLSWKVNPYYTKAKENLEPQYIPNVISFDVLKENSTEPSMFMQKYLSAYKLPDLANFKQAISKKPLSNVMNVIENFEDTYKTNIQNFIDTKRKTNVINKNLNNGNDVEVDNSNITVADGEKLKTFTSEDNSKNINASFTSEEDSREV